MPVVNMVETGKNIKALIKDNGYTVKDIQEEFGFTSPNAIYKWQKGESLPTVDNLLGLSFMFGVTINDIVIAE